MNRYGMFFATSFVLSGFLGGCATSGDAIPTHAHAELKADASILVRGITWPGWAFSIRRSVERVNHVDNARVDLTTGDVSLFFSPNAKPDAEAIWQAIIDAGYTPVKLKMPEKVYDSAPGKAGS